MNTRAIPVTGAPRQSGAHIVTAISRKIFDGRSEATSRDAEGVISCKPTSFSQFDLAAAASGAGDVRGTEAKGVARDETA
ncbi:MAG: hypothetical protein AAF640_02835 [Pseudomonadota bacterium]